jgi:hypothetical protein
LPIDYRVFPWLKQNFGDKKFKDGGQVETAVTRLVMPPGTEVWEQGAESLPHDMKGLQLGRRLRGNAVAWFAVT